MNVCLYVLAQYNVSWYLCLWESLISIISHTYLLPISCLNVQFCTNFNYFLCIVVSQQEFHELLILIEHFSFATTYIIHSTNWLIYAISMKQFRRDLISFLINIRSSKVQRASARLYTARWMTCRLDFFSWLIIYSENRIKHTWVKYHYSKIL